MTLAPAWLPELEPQTGLEPATPGLGSRCPANWATEAYLAPGRSSSHPRHFPSVPGRQHTKRFSRRFPSRQVVARGGFEPPRSPLLQRCSASELPYHVAGLSRLPAMIKGDIDMAPLSRRSWRDGRHRSRRQRTREEEPPPGSCAPYGCPTESHGEPPRVNAYKTPWREPLFTGRGFQKGGDFHDAVHRSQTPGPAGIGPAGGVNDSPPPPRGPHILPGDLGRDPPAPSFRGVRIPMPGQTACCLPVLSVPSGSRRVEGRAGFEPAYLPGCSRACFRYH